MSMKRLIFSDLHLHPWAYGATVDDLGFNSRLRAQWEAAIEMVSDAESNGIKYAYFGGDLFHTHNNIHNQSLMVATDLFKRLRNLGIKIRAIPGNHDQANRRGDIHSLSFLADEEISGSWVDGDLRVRALPFTDDDERLKRFLGDVSSDEGGMVLLHQGVTGVPLSSGYVLDERLSPDMIPDNCRAFTGHYHFHRAITPNLTMIGNLTPLNWGDIDQEKGWVIWDDETGELERKVQTTSPNFISWGDEDNDLGRVENTFVRYTDPVEQADQEAIRAQLVEKGGALSVEFPVMKESGQTDVLRSGDKITIDQLVEDLEQQNTGRRREVGTELRKGTYEAPTL